ncbi:hypothetical protein HG535_0G01790 [Zygotorulaspora mrakii]|uniref:mRNA m(6)A methyltransferase n=1 Tax=Zygotorulaspora mrakii TaxID=42260 RepID=A0A7H9B6E4_ZYGMR|nr:uncharacterized protein HG535_0G01790 [Zygotorulaspora mrakii]QLG74295.1 hypothetical protein HG535_0G01790 [Zygotorulaspora mrakii]
MSTEQVLRFLITNHENLLLAPLYGDLRSIFCVYLSCFQDDDILAATFQLFSKALQDICDIADGSLALNSQAGEMYQNSRVEFIDVSLLKLMHEKINSLGGERIKRRDFDTGHHLTGSHLERMLCILNQDANENKSENILLRKLQKLLSTCPGSIQLAKEREQHISKTVGYIPICTNEKHKALLATIVPTSAHELGSIPGFKLSQAKVNCPGLIDCLQRKKHFIPNIKPHTDISLGDCSYLDTCHKLNSCRYTHYLQYIPENLCKTISAETKLANKLNENQKNYPFYTHGNCCSNFVKQDLPEQWIQCDVRKFDFTVLGKFSAVIADPAWNIHMNLPYGTCNDNELLELPFETLQDEGILFLWVTGRAIEMGKEFLTKWGYIVLHEISWVKTNQLSRTIVTGRTGHWLNHSKEHLLVGLKGNPIWLNRKIDTDIIVSATRETSRKPDELYGLIERLVGPHARKLEFFGRHHNLRPGWFTIGNQLPGVCIHELDVKKRYEQFLAKPERAHKHS